MAEKLLKKKAEREELMEEKQDLINMRIELEKINHCETIEKLYKKEFASNYIKKPQNRIEYEKQLVLEEEEEDEINKIYISYAKKFQKERKEKELQMIKDRTDQRAKISERLAKKIAEATKKKLELQEAMENAKYILTEEEGKESLRRMRLMDILEQKKISEENTMKKRHEAQEAVKWEMIQAIRSAELDEQWRQSLLKNKREQQMKTRAGYDEQCKEKAEREADDLKELRFFENDLRNKEEEEEIKYCDAAMEYVKQRNIPPYPVLVAIQVRITFIICGIVSLSSNLSFVFCRK